jgi:outer membrane biosynthesis protein TonB
MDANVFDLRRCLIVIGMSLAGGLSCAAQQAKPAPTPPATLCEPPSRAGRAAKGVGTGSGSAAAGDEVRAVFSQSEVTKRAEVLFKPEPDYPASEPGRWEVKLRVVLCPRGYVSDIEVLSKSPGDAAEKAVEAAREIRFIPAEKDGKRVAQYATVVYSHEVY